MSARAPWYRWAIAAYDKWYRTAHSLDHPAAQVGPVLSLEIRRRRRALRLPDGSELRRGERVGILHLNNRRIAALRADGRDPVATAFALRRQFLHSLRALAVLVGRDGRLADVQAFSAVTVYHYGLERLGFAPAPGDRIVFPRLVALYTEALLALLHPRDGNPGPRTRPRAARRVWISRRDVLARYGRAPEPLAEREPGASPPSPASVTDGS